MDGKKRQDKSN